MQTLNRLNQHLSDRIISEGKAMLATTIVNDQTVLRMCLINPRTTFDDVLSTLESLEAYAREFKWSGRQSSLTIKLIDRHTQPRFPDNKDSQWNFRRR